jgi:hypothetical protein
MTRIESNVVTSHLRQQEVYEFLSDLENIGKLMPEQVEHFTVKGDSCTFRIRGMATLGLGYERKTPFNEVVLKSDSSAPFDFLLTAIIGGINGRSTLQLVMDADMNPLIRMMAEKPLGNFLNMLVAKFSDLHAPKAS